MSARWAGAYPSQLARVLVLDRLGGLRLALIAMSMRWLVLAAVCMLVGCELEVKRAGETCKRSTECAAGLGCVRGKCSKDLGPIADESTVPDLGMGMAADDAAATAADGG